MFKKIIKKIFWLIIEIAILWVVGWDFFIINVVTIGRKPPALIFEIDKYQGLFINVNNKYYGLGFTDRYFHSPILSLVIGFIALILIWYTLFPDNE